MGQGICCNVCSKNIRECDCPDVTERLRTLAQSTHVYVGNIIEERITAGRSRAEDFADLNIHHPCQSLEEVMRLRRLDSP